MQDWNFGRFLPSWHQYKRRTEQVSCTLSCQICVKLFPVVENHSFFFWLNKMMIQTFSPFWTGFKSFFSRNNIISFYKTHFAPQWSFVFQFAFVMRIHFQKHPVSMCLGNDYFTLQIYQNLLWKRETVEPLDSHPHRVRWESSSDLLALRFTTSSAWMGSSHCEHNGWRIYSGSFGDISYIIIHRPILAPRICSMKWIVFMWFCDFLYDKSLWNRRGYIYTKKILKTCKKAFISFLFIPVANFFRVISAFILSYVFSESFSGLPSSPDLRITVSCSLIGSFIHFWDQCSKKNDIFLQCKWRTIIFPNKKIH